MSSEVVNEKFVAFEEEESNFDLKVDDWIHGRLNIWLAMAVHTQQLIT